MTRRARWVLVALVVALALALATERAWQARRTAAHFAAAGASAPVRAVELVPSDLAVARRVELVRTLAVSGSIKAVNSAVVKAKVAAEVRELRLREGDPVTAGEVFGHLDDTEFRWRLRQAEDQAAAARAQLEIAERALANNRALVDQGFISRTALDTSIASADGARASLQAALAAAEIARKAVRDTELRAPIGGLVSQRLVQPGERVAVEARLVEIVDLSRLELEAAVAPQDVVSLRVGQPARLQIDGLAQPVPATVARISPAAQAGTRAVLAYLAVQAGAGLRHGLFATASIELDRRAALVIPAAAVREDRARPMALVAERGRVAAREVRLGATGEADFGRGREAAVEVLQGIAEGETVLRATVGTLAAGTPLALPAPSGATPPSSAAAAARVPSAPPAGAGGVAPAAAASAPTSTPRAAPAP